VGQHCAARLRVGPRRCPACGRLAVRFVHRLLEATSLLRRTVELGLGVHDEVLEHERRLVLAAAALEA